jgi:hypothetical protein
MKVRKERLTVTVDRALIEAASRAVAAGRAQSLSGWVNLALEERVSKERRLLALADAVATYEKQHGEITQRELAEQVRADREAAHVIRGGADGRRPRRKRTRRRAA